MTWPMDGISCKPKRHFSLFREIPISQQRWKKRRTHSSCSSSVRPQMITSSAMQRTPSRPSRAWWRFHCLLSNQMVGAASGNVQTGLQRWSIDLASNLVRSERNLISGHILKTCRLMWAQARRLLELGACSAHALVLPWVAWGLCRCECQTFSQLQTSDWPSQWARLLRQLFSHLRVMNTLFTLSWLGKVFFFHHSFCMTFPRRGKILFSWRALWCRRGTFSWLHVHSQLGVVCFWSFFPYPCAWWASLALTCPWLCSFLHTSALPCEWSRPLLPGRSQ